MKRERLAILGAIVFGFSWWKSRNHGLVEARPSSEVTTEGYAIGTCPNDPFGAALPVDCGQPHEAEVYRILEAKDPEAYRAGAEAGERVGLDPQLPGARGASRLGGES